MRDNDDEVRGENKGPDGDAMRCGGFDRETDWQPQSGQVGRRWTCPRLLLEGCVAQGLPQY